jgi:ribosomal protein S18 acetylase RimI-like enzyme
MNLLIRVLNEDDATIISTAFQEQGWNKPIDQYQMYFSEQGRGERVTLVAEVDGVFAGYVNVVWKSHYSYFRENNIPEINDFNVLIKFRRMGTGSKLMDRAEEIISERSAVAGIGVGVFSDYGNAQVLYVKRGYIPDGNGIHNGQRYIQFGESIVVDDDIVLYFTKSLERSKAPKAGDIL